MNTLNTNKTILKTICKQKWTLIKDVFKQHSITLRDYQKKGIKWLIGKEVLGMPGGILADEPGLGKTFQSLSVVLSGSGITLVVVPASIIPQWFKDAKLLCGEEAVYLHHSKHKKKQIPSTTKMVLTTPQTLIISDKYSGLANLHDTQWERIIIDEIQCMKNASSKIYKVARTLKATYRWGLTGTPIQNNRKEVINLFRFIYNLNKFQDLPATLEECIDRDMIRRKKIDKLDLKPILVENLVIPFCSDQEKEFYKKVHKNVKKEFRALMEEGDGEQTMVILFELLLRLRQASIHPQLVIDGYERKWGKKIEPDWEHNSSKHQTLYNLIDTHPEDSSIIFSPFTSELNILEAELKSRNKKVMRIDGTNSAAKREEVLNTCQNNWNIHPTDKVDVLLIQIKAGGVGLNLQNFNRVYITSPDWNPANEEQAIARAWRLGQKKQVIVKRLLLKDDKKEIPSMDERIMGIQEVKRLLYSDLLKDDTQTNSGKIKNKGKLTLSKRDLSRLLR